MKIDLSLLRCPLCKYPEPIAVESHLHCPQCAARFDLCGEVPIFERLESGDIEDNLDSLKHRLKKYRAFYRFLVKVISPVYYHQAFQDKFITTYVRDRNAVALDLGAGNSRIDQDIINVDIFHYPETDLVCNLENLPIKEACVDVVLSVAVIEHLREPARCVAEMHRILKEGGMVYVFVPFIQGFHASPHDYQRYTREGLKILFADFSILEVVNGEGPVSGFLWILQEMLAIAFSFNSAWLHRWLYLFFMVVTFPLKYLDFFFLRHPCAHHIAGGFMLVARKGRSFASS